jgi:hypothetical protein
VVLIELLMMMMMLEEKDGAEKSGGNRGCMLVKISEWNRVGEICC